MKKASSLQKGGHVMLKSKPCEIVDISTSKIGKHGSAKCHIVGLDIFQGKTYEDILPANDTVTVPAMTYKHYQLVCMDKDGNTRVDLKAGDDINWLDQSIYRPIDLIYTWTPSTSQLYRQEKRFEVIDAARLNQLFAENSNKGHSLQKSFFVTVLSACGTEKVIIVQYMPAANGFLFYNL